MESATVSAKQCKMFLMLLKRSIKATYRGVKRGFLYAYRNNPVSSQCKNTSFLGVPLAGAVLRTSASQVEEPA